jgi:hypothetical protein
LTDTLVVDEVLKSYATERQWECYRAVVEHGSRRAAAIALGVNESTVRRSVAALLRMAAQQGYAPDQDILHPVPDGLTIRGTSVLYDQDGNISRYWNKTKAQGREVADSVQLPDPKKIVKISTLYDQQGRVAQQWIAEKPEDKAREELWHICAKAMAEKLPRIEPIAPPVLANENLMVCYPVGDHHLGMLAWDEETGANYDISIGEKLLYDATDYLVSSAPPSTQALVAFLGDFIHYDSFEAVTPSSRNLLDADGRYPKMVRAAIRSMRYLIERVAEHHQQVHVIVEIGNHDLSSSIFLMECLANVYENEPRITIDTSPAHFHYFEFGTTLIGTHHGHGVKMDRLPLIMATDRASEWGRTQHRYWWTGHVHNAKTQSVVDQAQDYNGCSVESFRVLAPADAWASQKGYRSTRDMKSIVIHREFGEVDRHTANPAMFSAPK